jgi:hypothetical protein
MRSVREGWADFWKTVDLGASVHGKLSFLVFVGSALAAAFTVLQGWLGKPAAALVAVLALTAVLSGLITLKAMKREVQRLALAEVTGTLIPPGHNAIITGSPSAMGEWVPPGYDVLHGSGALADHHGNVIHGGSDNRIYGALSATVGGVNNVVGERPY